MQKQDVRLGVAKGFAPALLMLGAAVGVVVGDVDLFSYVPLGHGIYYLLPAVLCVLFAVLALTGSRENARLLWIPTGLLMVWEMSAALNVLGIGHGWSWYWQMDPVYLLQNLLNPLLMIVPGVVFCLAVGGRLKQRIACGVVLASCVLWCAANWVVFPLLDPYGDYEFTYMQAFHAVYRLGCYLAFTFTIRSLKEAPEAQAVESGGNWPVKNIAVCVVLSLVTCGIYQLFWAYSLCKNIRRLNGEPENCAGEFLCLMFVPFYGLYWMYTRCQKITKGAAAKGVTIPYNGTACLVLQLFGLGVVAYALMQNSLNAVAGRMPPPAAEPAPGSAVEPREKS